MDIVDQAQDAEALFIALALHAVNLAAPPLRATGQCYNCLANVTNDLRFCDSSCRDDFASRKAAETRRGIVRG
jgi:hypothetical protein